MEPIYSEEFKITDLYIDCFGRLLPSKILYMMQEVAGHHPEQGPDHPAAHAGRDHPAGNLAHAHHQSGLPQKHCGL